MFELLVKYFGSFVAGRYCEWQINGTDKSNKIDSFEEYMKTLNLFCEDGDPAYLNWTVPLDAPDLLYYQVKLERKNVFRWEG